ncbi:MAG TPA: Maf family protein [Hanamia sp.]|nr:Maf family protein [Hanamia sp.]
MKKIILASASPRRSQLLQTAEIEFEILIAPTDENYPEQLSPADIALHISLNKALEAQKKLATLPNNVDAQTILAADTIVVLDNRIIGKPADREEAINTLSELSGKTHKVITGVTILSGKKIISFTEETEVAFYELSKEQIAYYVDQFKPYDKAGAYAIQEWIGIVGIRFIKGDFYNVMGLPVSRVIQELKKLN